MSVSQFGFNTPLYRIRPDGRLLIPFSNREKLDLDSNQEEIEPVWQIELPARIHHCESASTILGGHRTLCNVARRAADANKSRIDPESYSTGSSLQYQQRNKLPGRLLHLFLRPSDPYCHSIKSQEPIDSPCSFVVRVKRRCVRRNGTESPQVQVKAEIVGQVFTQYSFNSLADFQFLCQYAYPTDSKPNQVSRGNSSFLQPFAWTGQYIIDQVMPNSATLPTSSQSILQMTANDSTITLGVTPSNSSASVTTTTLIQPCTVESSSVSQPCTAESSSVSQPCSAESSSVSQPCSAESSSSLKSSSSSVSSSSAESSSSSTQCQVSSHSVPNGINVAIMKQQDTGATCTNSHDYSSSKTQSSSITNVNQNDTIKDHTSATFERILQMLPLEMVPSRFIQNKTISYKYFDSADLPLSARILTKLYGKFSARRAHFDLDKTPYQHVPSEPLPVPSIPYAKPLFYLFRELFNLRPIWTASQLACVIESQISKQYIPVAFVLPAVAYFNKKLPYLRCWIRLGYDPRKESESRIFNTFEARISNQFTTEQLNMAKDKLQEAKLQNNSGPTGKRTRSGLLRAMRLKDTESDIEELDIDAIDIDAHNTDDAIRKEVCVSEIDAENRRKEMIDLILTNPTYLRVDDLHIGPFSLSLVRTMVPADIHGEPGVISSSFRPISEQQVRDSFPMLRSSILSTNLEAALVLLAASPIVTQHLLGNIPARREYTPGEGWLPNHSHNGIRNRIADRIAERIDQVLH